MRDSVDGRGLNVAEHEGLERSGFHVGDLLRFGVGFHGLEVGGGILSGDAARQGAEVGNANAQHAFHTGMQAARELCISAFGQVQQVGDRGEGIQRCTWGDVIMMECEKSNPHYKNRIDLIAEDCSKELSFTYFEQVISCQTTNNGSCEDSDLSLNMAYRFVEGE